MPDVNSQPDVRVLVRWLGSDGAKAGLSQSKLWTIDALRDAAARLGLKLADKTNRQQLIEEIVKFASKRIDKKLEDLFGMNQDELTHYFESLAVERTEILDLLKELNLAPGREGNRNLLEFAAREISETGRFMRIANK